MIAGNDISESFHSVVANSHSTVKVYRVILITAVYAKFDVKFDTIDKTITIPN